VTRDSTDSAVPPYKSRQQALRGCDHPGCTESGEFRAPRSRNQLTSYFWFCLDHVRAYNRAWNFCEGMTTNDVETNLQRDAVWRRPSWRFGTAPPRGGISLDDIDDALGILGNRRRRPPRGAYAAAEPEAECRTGSGRRFPSGSAEARAARLLDLAGPLTLAVVKARYKELAKRLHPDANGGCKKSEDRLKSVNAAYVTLRKSLLA
jgi:hypothetical protein